MLFPKPLMAVVKRLGNSNVLELEVEEEKERLTGYSLILLLSQCFQRQFSSLLLTR